MNLTWLILLGALGLEDAPPLDAPTPPRVIKEQLPEPAARRMTAGTWRALPVDGLIRFRNGDTLHGVLDHVEAGQLQWRHVEAREALRFGLANVMQISLATTGTNDFPRLPATVFLTNGDTLRGTVKSLDAETLTLETSFAGLLKLKRAMVRRLEPSLSGERLILDGPGSLADWKSSGQWQLRGGTLMGSQPGSIGRDVGLPDRCRVEFDLAWPQLPVILQVGLYGQRPEVMDGSDGAYWFGFNGFHATLSRIAGNASIAFGNVDIRKFLRTGKLHVALFIDKSKKTFSLVLDGQLVRTWAETGEWAGLGKCLVFGSQAGREQSIHISNLLIREWAGDLDNGAPVETGQQDTLCLANNDRLTGTVKGIADGQVTIDSSVSTLTIPVERVAQIHLPKNSGERARRMAADVIAIFHEGGRVTFALEGIGDKTITGTSENFGKAAFTRSAFRELQLHIYDDDRGEEADLDAGAIPDWLPQRRTTTE